MKISRIIVLIIFLFSFVLSVFLIKAPQSDIFSAFLTNSNKSSKKLKAISKLTNLSSNEINIIFKSNSEENLDNLKSKFYELYPIDHAGFIKKYADVTDIYKKYPNNFLSEKTRNLIKNNDYNTIATDSYNRVYNPLGYYIIPLDIDPYQLTYDFIFSSIANYSNNEIIIKGNDFYSITHLIIKSKKDVKKLIEAKKEINKLKEGEVFLSGAPIHSYISEMRSTIEINIICLISTIAFILICYYYFRTVKILLPIALSIIFGILSGLFITIIAFKSVHILAFVFSTSLIGISIDYSLHYFISNKEKSFKKSLLISLFSTILAFIALYFSSINVLKQIAVFTVFGLLGVYLFVVLFLPLFKIEPKVKSFQLPNLKKYRVVILVFILAVIIFGFFKIQFLDDIKALYKPKGELLKAETIYNNINNSPKISFILVDGDNLDKILEKEETLKKELDKNTTNYYALSNYISSTKRQKENQELIKKLYKNNLAAYATFLDKKRKDKLLANPNTEVFEPNNFPLKNKFLIDDNTSYIILENASDNFNQINLQKEISNILVHFRIICLMVLPVIFIILYIVLSIFLGKLKALKVIAPSLLGGLFSLATVGIFQNQITAFHILAYILVIGFSLDYSIFRISGSNNSNLAVFISLITSLISFTLLSFVGFNIISSLGLVLSVGIFASYILSLVLISNESENI